MRRGIVWILAVLSACAPAPIARTSAPAAHPDPRSSPPALAPAPSAPSTPSAAPPPAAPPGNPLLRRITDWRPEDVEPEERVRRAEQTRLGVVKQLFAAAGVAFPPKSMLFRAFKRDKELEVWASSDRGGKLSLIAVYEICALSGALGPKRREGDGQVPEGFYRLNYFWPNSNYHLEMKVGYPNDLDRHLSERVPEGPGGNIMIHGTCASIGCLAMTDERVEELWVMASPVQQGDDRVHVHIFPARDLAALLKEPGYEEHRAFWTNLKEGYDLFERTRKIPRVEADWHARYLFR
jgi:hypothetical protein